MVLTFFNLIMQDIQFLVELSVQFSHSVMLDSLRPHGLKYGPSFTISWRMLKFVSIESVMPSNHLFLGCPLFLLPSIFPSIREELTLHIRWSKYWSFSFSISPSNEHLGLISFRTDWFDLAVQGTLESLLQHRSSKASVLQQSAFFMVQLSYPCTTTGKTVSLTMMDLCQQTDVSAF